MRHIDRHEGEPDLMGHKRYIATVGTFDGVHPGHRLVLQTAARMAEARRLKALAIVFDRHPLETVAPHRAPGMLTGRDTRNSLIEEEGVSVMEIPFDENIRKLSAYEWMRKIRDEHGVAGMVIGYDNTFGCDGLHHSLSAFEQLGEKLGMDIVIAPVINGVSSSIIRKAVAAGDMEKCMELLGRPYELDGIITHGRAIGRTMGYPTANLRPDPRRMVPAEGVYATAATLPDGTILPAMTNIGCRPTFETGEPVSIEACILGWNGDLYGKSLSLRFLKRLRDEKKFSNGNELKAQLQADASHTEEIFSRFCKSSAELRYTDNIKTITI